ncbi:MAG: hypothetical protein JRJ44_02345 [Deltaproteobacteria bacterium]|nr:hypothetical protein [Deltaproteobacteria bacterium]
MKKYGKKPILNRPDKEDKKNPEKLKQTFLEQINTNRNFREISKHLQAITCIHLVYQLLHYADSFQKNTFETYPLGQGFLAIVAQSNIKTHRNETILWLKHKKSPNLILRFAVMETKSWIMADREAFGEIKNFKNISE